MVRVITIMDDVYGELSQMKKRKGMSFSEVLRHLLQESQREGKGLIGLAGSVEENDIDRRIWNHARGERHGKNLLG